MAFFEGGYGRSRESESSSSEEKPIHRRFTILENGTQGNMLFRSDHPERLKERPFFVFSFQDSSVLDIFDDFDHPVLVEHSADGYKATVWCERDSANENKDLATMEEMVTSAGGKILDDKDPRDVKKKEEAEELPV